MRYIFTIIILLGLVGCGSVNVENKLEARLMPKPIAEKVLLKYFSSGWVKNPVGAYVHSFCSDNGLGPMPFREINSIRVFNYGATTIQVEKFGWLPCYYMKADLKGNFSEQDIRDIVDALVSLGAKIDEIKRG
jgi:hypothetical protein